MKKLLGIAAILAVSACQPTGTGKGDEVANSALENATAQISRLEKENADLRATIARAQRASVASKRKEADERPVDMDGVYADPEPLASAPVRKLCWQDYCPCDGPETALDTTICRNAKGGIEMSDEQWATGAQARDFKRSGDKANREMDSIIADMKARRK
jgi:hypothetical protein